MPGGRVWEHSVQAARCLSEKWPCVCLGDCIFFSCYLHASLFTSDSACILYTLYTSLSHRDCVCVRTCVCLCVFFSFFLVWLGAAPAVSKWAAPNAWTPRRGRKGGSKGKTRLSWTKCVCVWGGVRGKNGGNGAPQFQVQVAEEKGTEKCFCHIVKRDGGCAFCCASRGVTGLSGGLMAWLWALMTHL